MRRSATAISSSAVQTARLTYTFRQTRRRAVWCPCGVHGPVSQRGPVVASLPTTSPRCGWVKQATGGGASPCQAQGRRFDPGHPLSGGQASAMRARRHAAARSLGASNGTGSVVPGVRARPIARTSPSNPGGVTIHARARCSALSFSMSWLAPRPT